MIRFDRRLHKPTKEQAAIIEEQKKVFTYLVATAIASNDKVLPHQPIDGELLYNVPGERMICLVAARIKEAKAA